MTTTHTAGTEGQRKERSDAHTPGPWAVANPAVNRFVVVPTKGSPRSIAVLDKGWDNNAVANAALIAAAPELLSALYDARQALLHLPITPGGIAHIAQMHIDEAIAKATGE